MKHEAFRERDARVPSEGCPRSRWFRNFLIRQQNQEQRLDAAEWGTAAILTLTVLVLLAVQSLSAGSLWRDECGAAQLARMPAIADVINNFHFEAFPLLFPLIIRTMTNVFGTSDAVFRGFGFVVGVLVVCVLWLNAWLLTKKPPLLSLALIGLNTTFLVWGTSVRGYGIGGALILLAFGQIAKTLLEPTPRRFIFALIASLLCVHCLLYNSTLLAAICLGAMLVFLNRGDTPRALIILVIGVTAAISIIPYIGQYSAASHWNIVLKHEIDFLWLWTKLTAAIGATAAPAVQISGEHVSLTSIVWQIVLIAVMAGGIWRLVKLRGEKPSPQRDLILFAVTSASAAALGYYIFLRILSYLTQTWYYLALVMLLAVSMELLFHNLIRTAALRRARIWFVFLLILVVPAAGWKELRARHSNIDVIAQELEQNAQPGDLIVLNPWYYGVTFNWYYKGTVPWITVPAVGDLRTHRYDMVKEKMVSERPINDVKKAISSVLQAGNYVWFVGGVQFPPSGQAPHILPAAPNSQSGWLDGPYTDSWSEQIGALLNEYETDVKQVQLPGIGIVNNFENVPLVVVSGVCLEAAKCLP